MIAVIPIVKQYSDNCFARLLNLGPFTCLSLA